MRKGTPMPKPSEKRITWETLKRMRLHCQLCQLQVRCGHGTISSDACHIWASLPEVEVAHDIDIFMITVNSAHKKLLAAVEKSATNAPAPAEGEEGE